MKKIAILGPKNTYSEVAAKVYQTHTNESYELSYQKRIADVFESINSDTLGIIPIENTLEGYVQQHLDYLLEYPHCTITKELRLDVSFTCISHVSIETVQTLYVQYATKNQCQKFIDGYNHLNLVVTDSNTQSYEAYLKDENSAVIIPNHIYQQHMAPYEYKDVTDETHNQTRFWIVEAAHNFQSDYEDYKMAMVFTPKVDRPGLLLSIIESFAKASINLISIMSRPTKKAMGTYHFFIELECKVSQVSQIQTILMDLSIHMDVRLLGIFPNLSE